MVIELIITNWEKYNPRSDVKSASWLRFSNDFFSDPDFYGKPLELRFVFVYILCASSKKMDLGRCKINTKMISDQVNIDEKIVKKSIDELILMGCIAKIGDHVITTRSDPNSNSMLMSATNERTDERTYVRAEKKESSTCGAAQSWKDWVKAYQEITGNKDGLTKNSKTLIEARIKQGFTLEDCSLVAEHKKNQWGNDDKMRKYLRPATIFSGKFETYADEARNRGENDLDSRVNGWIRDHFPNAVMEDK